MTTTPANSYPKPIARVPKCTATDTKMQETHTTAKRPPILRYGLWPWLYSVLLATAIRRSRARAETDSWLQMYRQKGSVCCVSPLANWNAVSMPKCPYTQWVVT